MNSEDALATFQATLLTALSTAANPHDVKMQLLMHPGLADYHPYIQAMDETQVAIGIDLVRRWGRTTVG